MVLTAQSTDMEAGERLLEGFWKASGIGGWKWGQVGQWARKVRPPFIIIISGPQHRMYSNHHSPLHGQVVCCPSQHCYPVHCEKQEEGGVIVPCRPMLLEDREKDL